MAERPLRVAVVVPFVDDQGGMETQARLLARALRERGCAVTLVSSLNLRRWWRAGWRPGRREPLDGTPTARVVLLQRCGLFDRLFPYLVERVLRRQRGSFDVVQGCQLHSGGFAAVRAATRLGLPSVVKTEGGGRLGDAAWQRRRLGAARRLATLRGAAAYVVLNEEIAAELAALGLDAERMVAIPNAVDTAYFRPRTDAGDEAVERPDERGGPGVVYAGRLHPLKGLDTLLDAWAGIARERPRARLDLCGEGPLRAHLAGRVAAERLDGSVRLHGRLDPGALRDALWAAAVAVLPSEAEGMSTSLLEAMACALPVVASDLPANRAVVPHGAGILVPVGDAGALRAALAELLAAPERAREMGRVGRAHVSATCAVEVVAERYLELYCGLVRAGRGAAAPRAGEAS